MTAPGANCFIRSSNTDASGELESKPDEGRFVWIQRMKIGSGQVMLLEQIAFKTPAPAFTAQVNCAYAEASGKPCRRMACRAFSKCSNRRTIRTGGGHHLRRRLCTRSRTDLCT
ncbi:hypothetical protein [Desulfocurvibacter africanus]|uniref:hypothetical protein n=1 Tax=Desulfocurvibacter africanus TaxID=873 RepID=UPI000424320D|nr:hypothetical protein [Desulfocurvibacter africanus]